ncbi:MAG: hypothetical protein ACXWJV_07065, partial [Hyphomicrobium sp.]
STGIATACEHRLGSRRHHRSAATNGAEMEEAMHRLVAAAAVLAALPAIAPSAHAASIPAVSHPAGAVIAVQERQQRSQRDCTPYNGPFGFYGNVWCQPPNEQSYMRNLGSRWPMETPPSLRNPKPATNNSDW